MLEPTTENLRRHAKEPIPSASRWDDPAWEWDMASPGTPENQKQVRWDFKMADGTRFNEPQWHPWAEAMKIAVWSLMADPPEARKKMRTSSVRNFHTTMRILVQWMHDNRYERLNQLTRAGQRAFMRDVRRRKGKGASATVVKSRTLAVYQDMLQVLFLQGRRYPQITIGEPAPQDAIKISEARKEGTPIPRTPDGVAIPLIRNAVRLLGPPADDIIEARDRLLEISEDAQKRNLASHARPNNLRKALKARPLAWKRSREETWYRKGLGKNEEIRNLCDRLTDAAFIVLSYLVGMRISEILGLKTGCITKRPSLSGDETFTFVTGKIYKTAPTADGEPHEWVAPPIVERAVEVLERVSLPLRKRTGEQNLWLTAHGKGVTPRNAKIGPLSTHHMDARLNVKFAPFIDLPLHEGEAWHLSSHQGRKTFAYLVAKQDRSGLYALKEHLGHRSIVMTDQAYSGHGHHMTNLIGEAGSEEMEIAFADVLTAPELAGKGGEEIAKRSPFRGQLITEGALEYARQRLRETGLCFEVCDYGYCYYNVRHAACHGDEHGPNRALRTQSVCVECKNFVVTPKHLPLWRERHRKYKAVLEHTEMAPAAASAARAKVAECEGLIQSLERGQAAEPRGDT